MKNVLPRFAYALLAILVLAAVLLTIGQRETDIHPSATSYNPSGLHAFQELLERNGIPTEVTRLQQPRLSPSDLVIAAYSEESSPFRRRTLDTIQESLKAHLKKGGKVLVLPFDPDFRATSQAALKSSLEIVNAGTGDRVKVNHSNFESSFEGGDVYDNGASESLLPISEDALTFASWNAATGDHRAFVTLSRDNGGTLARTAEGLFATNRFIDREDNGKLALALVQGLLQPGGKVVFAEATLGRGIEPSLVSTLGPWAVGAWMQLLVLFLVIVFTLGIRFGLPEIERRTQRGQRELIDAVSDIYRRSGSVIVALDAAYVAADASIRRAYRMPSGIDSKERDAMIPEELGKILHEIEVARKPIVDSKGRIGYLVTSKEARALLDRLEGLLFEYLPSAKNRIS